ncbi:MAG TPA: PaaI family thioesterase [Nevskiales bacterium]|nr:PaaI family thioesterase [Nevskiales bacterium]
MTDQDPLIRLRRRALALPRSLAERSQWQAAFNASPAAQHFGLRVDLSDPQFIAVRLDQIQPWHRGGLGTPAVNGAVIAAMFDLGLGLAGGQQFPQRPTGTIDLSIKLMKPTLGPQVALYAWAVEKRTHVVFVEAEVHDAGNGVTAIGQGLVSASATLEHKT